MQDRATRAGVVLKILHGAIIRDNQDQFDFCCEVIDADQLYEFYETNDGEPVRSYADFAADVEKDIANAAATMAQPR